MPFRRSAWNMAGIDAFCWSCNKATPHMSDSDLLGHAPDPAGRALSVVECRVYRGPHLYDSIPMVCIQLDLGSLEQWPSDRLEGFPDRLAAMLPGLQSHGCSYHEAGGFIRRLVEGTWLGHIAEHVAIELQSLV